jgi:hypothetical protein
MCPKKDDPRKFDQLPKDKQPKDGAFGKKRQEEPPLQPVPLTRQPAHKVHSKDVKTVQKPNSKPRPKL